nr:RNA-directed DNA polymerase, eukaryota [Tanacetum cinerariifolium]
MVHKSYSSIFDSNIPWKAMVQDIWDSCNQWGVVIDVYIAAKRSKSGHRFGFVRFKNVNDINLLVSNLRVTWMGGFYLFADVANHLTRMLKRSWAINQWVCRAIMMQVIVREKPVGGAVSNKVNEESSNEALMFISEDDCIDLDCMERSILSKVKYLSVITDLLKYMSYEGFVDVCLRYVGGRWVWLKFDSTDQVESVKNSKVLNEIFLKLKDVSYDFIPDERCVWIDLVGLSLASWAPEVYKKLGGRWGCSVFTDMVNDRPLSHGKILEDHFDGDRRNDTIEDNADVNPSTNVYLDVNQNTSIPEVVEDLSSLDRSSDKAERLAHHNNSLDDLDISLRNRLLHQDKCRVRPVKAAVNDSSIMSPSTPPITVLNLAEESCSTWLDYVGPLITDELD